MTNEEIIETAQNNGINAATISMCMYLIKEYEQDISPRLRLFLEKLCASSCEDAGESMKIPSEDVALMGRRILEEIA